MTKPASTVRGKPQPGRVISLAERRRRVARQGPYQFAKVYVQHLLVAQNDVWDRDPAKHDDAKVLIPAGKPIDSAQFHHDIWDAFRDAGGWGLRLAYIAPRGFAKSTVVTILVLWLAAFKLRKFVVWSSETASQVEELVASLIDETEANQRLLDDFPHLAPAKASHGHVVKWTDRDLVMASGFRLSARGAQKSTRGLRRGANRPDLVICDDAEGEHSVGQTQYPKMRRWLTRVLAPALSPGGDILWIGTLIDWTSVTGALIRRDEDWTQNWTVRHLQAEWYEASDGTRVDADTLAVHAPGEPRHGAAFEGDLDQLHHRLLWSDYWPQERLDAFREENGRLAYSYEMLNKPLDDREKVFRDADWLKWATVEQGSVFLDQNNRDRWISERLLTHVTAIDPAFGGKDYAAVVTVGVFQHDFVVRETWWYRRDDVRTQMVAETVRQAEDWNSRIIVVESTAAQVLLADEFIRKSRIPVQKHYPTKSKVDRALPVAVRASQGHVYFESGVQNNRVLREILLQFPSPLPDDPVDAFVMAIEGAAELRSKFLVTT